MSFKVSHETLFECLKMVLDGSKDKKRKFVETVELQIGLKNWSEELWYCQAEKYP